MRICQNCNTPVDENAAFCVNCGVKLVNQPVNVQEKAINEQPPITEQYEQVTEQYEQAAEQYEQAAEQYEQSNFKSTETSSYSQPVPPAGTPVYNQPVSNNYCCTPHLNQAKPSSKGQLAWAIVLLCFAVMFSSPIFAVMQIIAIICISDSKVAVNTEIFMHKLKTAKILNIISTVCLSLILCGKMVSGLLTLTELLSEDDFSSYFSDFYY